jgi:putative transposase
MKKTKFTEQQIAFALKQAETGTRVDEVCRKMGISEAMFYNWKEKYGGLGVPELRRLRQLEDENNRLKQIVADLTLDKQMLQDVLKKIPEDPPAKGAGGKAERGLSAFPLYGRWSSQCTSSFLRRTANGCGEIRPPLSFTATFFSFTDKLPRAFKPSHGFPFFYRC